jgi:hypothetical protein
MSDETDTHTNNDFVLKAANSIAVSRTAQGAALGAGILLVLGLLCGAWTLKADAYCGGIGATIGASFGMASGMRAKSELLLEQALANRTPEKNAGSGPKPPAI